jgi:two-component system, cell cycle response regulator DivK
MKTVLVVDDNPINLELLGDVLEAAGFAVLKTEQAAHAIHLAQQEQPDIVLMDIDMPGMDGYEALRLLRADQRTHRIPTVAVTAFAMPDDQQRVMDAGFDGYITKPIGTRTVAKVVEEFVNARKTE